MCVIVSASFSQGAIFYAGEAVTCTISFSHSLQSSVKATKHQHARTRSFSSFDMDPTTNGNNILSPKRSNSINSTASEIESSAPPTRKLSLSSLASSTFSYFTGSSFMTTATMDSYNSIVPSKEHSEKTAEPSESIVTPSEMLTIELDNHNNGNFEDEEDDKSSITDTQSQYTGTSRRSSIDSTASNLITRQFRHTRPNRLSAPLLHRPPSFTPSKQPEHLLMGFAQVVGQFVLDPVLVNSSLFAPLKAKTMYHPSDMSSVGGSGGGGMFTTNSKKSKYNLKKESCTIPVYSTPPSILFVDLNLAPGEIVKFSYKLQLPKSLPPSYRGKSMKFNYYLVIGSQKSSSKAFGSQSHVVQIPFRVFNHVTEDGNRPVYDLMSPEINHKDQALVEKIDEDSLNALGKEAVHFGLHNSQQTPRKKKSAAIKGSSRQEFKDYIDGLLEKTASNKSIYKIMQKENDLYDSQEEAENRVTENGEPITEKYHDKMFGNSCRQIVSQITNTSKRATFDICKSHQRVAQLHLLKTLYRLGEPIIGVIDFEGAVIPTFQMSVFLESNEIVDTSIAQRQANYIARVSKKRHAGHHAFCRYDTRLTFSLAVPTCEAPEFQTSAMTLQYYLKLEFITGSSDQQIFDTFTAKHHEYTHYKNQLQSSSFDCQIPIHILGSTNESFKNSLGGPHIFKVQ